jgi:Undecaprenyl-phosphate glucose phosphotransferase
MEARYKAVVSVLFRLTDATVVVAAWLAAYWARFFLPSVVVAKVLPPFRLYASLVPPVALVWMVVFAYAGVYESGRMRGRKGEVLMIWRAHLVAFLIFVAIAYSYDAYRYSRLVMFYFAGIGAIALAVFRVTLRTGLRYIRKRGLNLCRVLVVGGGPTARKLVERFQQFPELGMRVTGVLTQDGKATGTMDGVPVVGSFLDVRRVVDSERPNQVLVVLPPQQQFEIFGLLGRLDGLMVKVRIVPDFEPYAPLECRVEHFEGMPVIRLNNSPVDDVDWVVKRAFDIVVSGIGLIIVSPLLLVIAACVKLSSPGPVLYAQERMGLDGQTFRMYKFRSMRTDAERAGAAVWTTRGDDRRTPSGRILRQTSLDELPQLWNVLVGHMSLVGPRPERPVFVQEFRQRIPDYMMRHKVKSGITGWAQVNGWRGDTSLTERTACDLYYIRNWSLELDIKILLMTLWRGFINKNAY